MAFLFFKYLYAFFLVAFFLPFALRVLTLLMFFLINSKDCCTLAVLVSTVRPSFLYWNTVSKPKYQSLVAFVGFGRRKPNKSHPASVSYAVRLQNWWHLLWIFTDVKRHFPFLSSLFSLLSPMHFFLAYIATCWVLGSVMRQSPSSDSSHTLAPNTKYTAGTGVESCWMSTEGCGHPLKPPDRRRKQREDWSQGFLAPQKASNAFFASGRCLCYRFFSASSGISMNILKMYNLMGKGSRLGKVVVVEEVFEGKGEELHFKLSQMNMTLF